MSSCRPIFLFSVYSNTNFSFLFFPFFPFFPVIWRLSISQKLPRYVSVFFFALPSNLPLLVSSIIHVFLSIPLFIVLFSKPPVASFLRLLPNVFFLAGSNYSVGHGYSSAAQTESGVGRVITSTLIMEATRHCISIILIKYGLTKWIMEGL